MVMSIASCSHRQSAVSGILKSRMIVPFERARSIEDLYGIDRKGIKHVLSYAGPEKIVRMRRDNQAGRLMNQTTNFQSRSSLKIWQNGSDTKQVSLRGCNFDPWNDKKIVHG